MDRRLGDGSSRRPNGARVSAVAALAIGLVATLLVVSTAGVVFVVASAVGLAAPAWCHHSLRSVAAQSIRIGALDLDVTFGAGEEMRTEISAKFRRERVSRELAEAGLRLTHWWTDPDGDFALSLSEPV